MVGMEMRDDQPGDAAPRQRAFQQRVPAGAAVGDVETGIDERHPLPVLKHPDVDVLERARNRQPRPADALGKGDQLAWLRDAPAERIGEALMGVGLVGDERDVGRERLGSPGLAHCRSRLSS
jgi:hypothetical protein